MMIVFFSSRRRHTRLQGDWSSDVCSSDLPYKKGKTYEDYLGLRGLEKLGRKKWEKEVAKAVAQLRQALQAEHVVLGGGNAKKLEKLPPDCELGSNRNAFVGGFRMWREERSEE